MRLFFLLCIVAISCRLVQGRQRGQNVASRDPRRKLGMMDMEGMTMTKSISEGQTYSNKNHPISIVYDGSATIRLGGSDSSSKKGSSSSSSSEGGFRDFYYRLDVLLLDKEADIRRCTRQARQLFRKTVLRSIKEYSRKYLKKAGRKSDDINIDEAVVEELHGMVLTDADAPDDNDDEKTKKRRLEDNQEEEGDGTSGEEGDDNDGDDSDYDIIDDEDDEDDNGDLNESEDGGSNDYVYIGSGSCRGCDEDDGDGRRRLKGRTENFSRSNMELYLSDKVENEISAAVAERAEKNKRKKSCIGSEEDVAVIFTFKVDGDSSDDSSEDSSEGGSEDSSGDSG